MEERGIGSANWVQRYVGIPYRPCGRDHYGIDCYGLVCLVYREVLGIELPDWLTQPDIDLTGAAGHWVDLDNPVDLCIVRSPRNNWSDHMGIFVGGAVLNATNPASCAPSLDSYLAVNPGSRFGAYELSMTVLS